MLHDACLRTQGRMVSSEYGHDCLSGSNDSSSLRSGTELGVRASIFMIAAARGERQSRAQQGMASH